MQQVSDELERLDKKIDDLVFLCAALKTENARLEQRLATVENEKQDLADRIATARTRLEQLAQNLPEDGASSGS